VSYAFVEKYADLQCHGYGIVPLPSHRVYIYTQTETFTDTLTVTKTHAVRRNKSCTRAYLPSYVHSVSHTHMYIHTRKGIDTVSLTHTHTHTPAMSLAQSSFWQAHPEVWTVCQQRHAYVKIDLSNRFMHYVLNLRSATPVMGGKGLLKIMCTSSGQLQARPNALFCVCVCVCIYVFIYLSALCMCV